MTSPSLPMTPRGTASAEAQRSDFIHALGFYSALVLIFLRFSFIHETFTYLTGVNTYVLYVFGPVALFSFFVSGGFQRLLRVRTGKYWICFLGWMALAVPASFWIGGSAMHVFSYLRTDFPMLLVTAGIARTWADCRKILYTIALAALVDLATAQFFMRFVDGRVSLSSEGSISNSNDLAAHLLTLLPFLLYFVLRPRAKAIWRFLMVGAIGYGLFEILRTGSRGALVALAVTCLFVLFRGSGRQRLVVGLTAPIGFVLLVTLLPGSTWDRLTSFTDQDTLRAEALESRESRQYLLKQSILYTFEHPLFGVGPGQFSSFEGFSRTSEGERGNWHETHNSYTQISSECGIPALIFYLMALFSTFGMLNQTQKRASLAKDGEVSAAAFCVTVALVAYSSATFFISFGYHFHLLALSGLAISMWLAVQDRIPALPSGISGQLWKPRVVRPAAAGEAADPRLIHANE